MRACDQFPNRAMQSRHTYVPGVRKSGMPADTEMPAPAMTTMFLMLLTKNFHSPSARCSRSVDVFAQHSTAHPSLMASIMGSILTGLSLNKPHSRFLSTHLSIQQLRVLLTLMTVSTVQLAKALE
jgi:hypothetical protein